VTFPDTLPPIFDPELWINDLLDFLRSTTDGAQDLDFTMYVNNIVYFTKTA
jgi:hypothetical protein